ncbi:MAG: hypothetical protein HQ521_14600, partial [Bacteroidetes bacterium]|nr:hypothetical protein [Bacteroidota bacterium]
MKEHLHGEYLNFHIMNRYYYQLILELLTLLLLPFFATSQTYFSERYNLSLAGSLDFSNGIICSGDSYIVPGGHTYMDSYSYNYISIMKLHNDGAVEFIKNFGDSTSSYNMNFHQGGFRETNEGDFYSVGARVKYTGNSSNYVGMIYKFDKDLDTLWTKSIGELQFPYDTTYIFRHFDLLPNNELIIIGSCVFEGSTSNAILLKTDSMGNELWRKYYFSGPLNLG